MAACGGKIKSDSLDTSSTIQDASVAIVSNDSSSDASLDSSSDASIAVDGSTIVDASVADADAAAVDSGVIDSGVVVVDSGVFVPPACSSIAGDWIWTEQSFTGTGCATADCGGPGLPTCATTNLMTATLPAPGKIHWSGMILGGASSEFDGTLQSNGMFSVAHTIFPANTITGVIDADCNLAARVTMSLGGCNAVIDVFGFTL